MEFLPTIILICVLILGAVLWEYFFSDTTPNHPNKRKNIDVFATKDPHDNFCEEGLATEWERLDYGCCPHCITPLTRRQWMSDVCLTCGNTFKYYLTQAITRQIKRQGVWVEQIRMGRTNYINRKIYEKDVMPKRASPPYKP